MDQACVAVCPVDCIHFEQGVDRTLYIDPDECIDCGACEPECPVTAIYPEESLPAEWASLHGDQRDLVHRQGSRPGGGQRGQARLRRARRRRPPASTTANDDRPPAGRSSCVRRGPGGAARTRPAGTRPRRAPDMAATRPGRPARARRCGPTGPAPEAGSARARHGRPPRQSGRLGYTRPDVAADRTNARHRRDRGHGRDP